MAGFIRWLVTTTIAALCLVFGIAPAEILAKYLKVPPAFLDTPWFRLGVIVTGLIFIWIWWRFIAPRPYQGAKPELVEKPTTGEKNPANTDRAVPILELVDRLVDDGRLAPVAEEHQYNNFESPAQSAAIRDIQTALNNGAVTTSGVRSQTPRYAGQEFYEAAPRPVPVTYWEMAELEPTGIVTRGSPQTIPLAPHDPAVAVYKNLTIAEAQIQKSWPSLPLLSDANIAADDAVKMVCKRLAGTDILRELEEIGGTPEGIRKLVMHNLYRHGYVWGRHWVTNEEQNVPGDSQLWMSDHGTTLRFQGQGQPHYTQLFVKLDGIEEFVLVIRQGTPAKALAP